VAARDSRLAPPEPEPAQPKKTKARPPKQARPTELEQLEAEIAGRESEISELERQLADDWANVDVVAAHRRARDELQTLLSRWEQLFDRSGA
jgi:predicted  nucleic acid-binding Zn-ribbon protein